MPTRCMLIAAGSGLLAILIDVCFGVPAVRLLALGIGSALGVALMPLLLVFGMRMERAAERLRRRLGA